MVSFLFRAPSWGTPALFTLSQKNANYFSDFSGFNIFSLLGGFLGRRWLNLSLGDVVFSGASPPSPGCPGLGGEAPQSHYYYIH